MENETEQLIYTAYRILSFAPLDSVFKEYRVSLAHERRTDLRNPTHRPPWDSGWRLPGNIPDRTDRWTSQDQ